MDKVDLPLDGSGANPVTPEILSLDVPAPLLDLPLRAGRLRQSSRGGCDNAVRRGA